MTRLAGYDYKFYSGIRIDYSEVATVMSCFHCHSMTELMFVVRGESEIITESGKLNVTGPFFVQYPEGMLHLQRNRGEYSRYQAIFPTDVLRKLLPPSITLDECFVIPVPEELVPRLLELYGMLFETAKPGSGSVPDGRRELLIALIYSYLSPIISSKITIKRPGTVSDAQRVFDICRYIGEHYKDKLTLEKLSREFFVSRSAIVRDFRLTLDMTVVEYITAFRIQKAKFLLKQGARISDVAECCGFSSDSYFTKVFRDSTGLTPAAFRAAEPREIGQGYSPANAFTIT